MIVSDTAFVLSPSRSVQFMHIRRYEDVVRAVHGSVRMILNL